MKKILIIVLLTFYQTSFTQNISLFDRLKAIHNSGITFYNVDGIDFTNENLSSVFNEKNLKKAYRKNKIKRNDPKTTDAQLSFENFKVVKQETFENGLVAINVYYFVKNYDDRISIFWFGYYDKDNPEFERLIIDLILNDKIPKTCFASLNTDTIDFAGRDIHLGGVCNWMNTNNVQCPSYGQMNWSLHQTKESADLAVQNQLKATKTKNGGKVISEQEVAIIFEGVPTTARKVHYDFTGLTSLVASLSGGENLTIYYVSARIRDHYVSCILSFWNNDNINPSGLPPLLEEVISFPKK